MKKKNFYRPTVYVLVFSVILLQVAYELVMASSLAQPKEKQVASAVAKSGDFALGVALAPDGGLGKEQLDIDVASGSRCLIVGVGGLTLRQKPEGVQVRIKNPQGRSVEQVITELTHDKALEAQMKSWANNVKGKERIAPEQLTTSKMNELLKKYPLEEQLKNKVNAFKRKLQNTPNLGIIARGRKGEILSMVILNPTPGKWAVEVNSQSNAKPFQVVSSAIPRQGLPNNIGAISRPIIDKLNRDMPRMRRIVRWGCDNCCWCQNLVGFGICVAIATALVSGWYWYAAGIMTAALLKSAAILISQYALFFWLSWKIPTPPSSIWDIIYGGIMDAATNYACRLAGFC